MNKPYSIVVTNGTQMMACANRSEEVDAIRSCIRHGVAWFVFMEDTDAQSMQDRAWHISVAGAFGVVS